MWNKITKPYRSGVSINIWSEIPEPTVKELYQPISKLAYCIFRSVRGFKSTNSYETSTVDSRGYPTFCCLGNLTVYA